mgnify:CR=1 FL=1
MKIKDLCAEDRPREKMLSNGPAALSNAELLAIVLHNGTVGQSVLELSQNLLHKGGDTLAGLFSMGTEQMLAVNGIGPAKAADVQAALELGRRFISEQSNCVRVPVTGPRMIYDQMYPLLKCLDHEECWVLFLNKANYVVARRKMTSGGADSTVIDVRQIARMALDLRARSIVLVHNHPSGNTTESSFDREYESKWSGSVEDAFFNAEMFDRARILKQPEYEASGRISAKQYYIISVDVGRKGCDSVVCIFKVSPQPQGVAVKSLVNIYTLSDEHFEDQATVPEAFLRLLALLFYESDKLLSRFLQDK